MANKDLPLKALLQRYKDRKLAHFYTLTTGGQLSSAKKDQILNEWVSNLLVNILSHENNWDLEHARKSLELGHEDILNVETDEKSYKVSDNAISAFFNFIRFRPSKLNYSITIFKQSQKISQILANKLLKTLEEPPEGHIFIFLKSSDEEALATIESRTIKINIQNNEESSSANFNEQGSFRDFLEVKCDDEELKETLNATKQGSLNLEQLKDLIKSKPEREATLHRLIASYVSNSTEFNYSQVQECLDVISASTYEIPFNGAAKSRMTRLIQFIV